MRNNTFLYRKSDRIPMIFISALIIVIYIALSAGSVFQGQYLNNDEDKLSPEERKILISKREKQRYENKVNQFIEIFDTAIESKYFDRNVAQGKVTEVRTSVNEATSVTVVGSFKKDDGTPFDVTWHCDMAADSKIPKKGDQVEIVGTWDYDDPTYEKNVWLIVDARMVE